MTESGFPVLANDPHRVLHLPSLRYFVHLTAPGWNVIGGGEPTLPGVSIGHNEHGAWGLTVFRIDAEDLYIYETHPTEPTKYRYKSDWEEMRIIREGLSIKGEGEVQVELKFTRHGPVIYADPQNHVACALRAGWLEAGSALYLASLRMCQVTTWGDSAAACSYSHLPGENMVWADAKGNIGWQAAGISPLRPNWSGLLPVPGDGRFEWDGYLPIRELPNVFNPEHGFGTPPTKTWFPRTIRTARWSAQLGVSLSRGQSAGSVGLGRKLNHRDHMSLQQDELSIPALADLVPLLRDLPLHPCSFGSSSLVANSGAPAGFSKQEYSSDCPCALV